MEFEESRICALNGLNILDTENEVAFDMVAELAALIFEAPISAISFIDLERQWFKAKYGIELDSISKKDTFCNYTIQSEGYFCVENADKDVRFKNNPLVKNFPHIKFYLGVPLVIEGSYSVGALCIIDSKERKLERKKLRSLIILGKQIELLLSARKALFEVKAKEKEKAEFVGHLVHDLKNPLTIIDGSLALIKRKKAIRSEGADSFKRCADVVKRMNVQLEQLLSIHLESIEDINVYNENISVNDLIIDVISQMSILCLDDQRIDFEDHSIMWITDKMLLRRMLENLISNSLKYGSGSNIKVIVFTEVNYLKIQVSDKGIGIPKEREESIFNLGFTKIESNRNQPSSSHGIGLHFCKRASNILGGDLKLVKNSANGVTFELLLPLAKNTVGNMNIALAR